MNYKDRLQALNISSLERRRLIFDLNLGYKIIYNLIDIDFNEFFTYSQDSNIRSHNLKLFVPRASSDIIKSYFLYRFSRIWNKLPQYVVEASNLNIFNYYLKELDLTEYLRGRGVR